MPEVGRSYVELLKRYFSRYILYSYDGLMWRVIKIVEGYLWNKYSEEKDTTEYQLSKDDIREIERLLVEDFQSVLSKGIRGFVVVYFEKGTLGRIHKPQEYIDFVRYFKTDLVRRVTLLPLASWLVRQFRKT
jgi:hypothetical protein